MFHKLSLLLTISIFALFQLFFNGVLADEAPPGIEFSGMNLVVNVDLDPSYLTANESDRKNLSIRIFDINTNQNLEKVSYRVEIWQDDELLARNLFYDIDGILNIKIKPEKTCSESKLHQCTKYFGSEHVSAPGAIYIENEGSSLITGPVFVKSGLYKIKVDIEGATGPTTLVANVPSFETFVSITKEQDFVVQTAQAQQIPITIKTYFEIDDLKFDQSDNSISFDMPFNWDHDYINQIKNVHEDITIPKSFEPYSDGKKFRGFINNIEVDNRVLLFDPYSNKNTNIIHFLITESELERINDNLDFSNNIDVMKFKIVPYGDLTKKSNEFYLVDTDTFESVDTTVNIAWDSQFGAGDIVPFEFAFFDENRNLIKDIRYGISLIDENEKTLFTYTGNDQLIPGIVASEGIDVQKIFIPNQGEFRIDVLVYGTGISSDQTYAGIGSGLIEVGPRGVTSTPIVNQPPDEVSIPDWVRNNAGWWSGGEISDNDFASGIEFMIKESIIKVPATSSGQASEDSVIPDWIRNNAGWWADGAITDKDFASGIQYLIEQGIISV